MNRSTPTVLWVLAVFGAAVGAFLLVLGLIGLGGDASATQVIVVTALGVLVLLGAAWQLRILIRHRHARNDLGAARAELRQTLDVTEPGWQDRSAASGASQAPVHAAAPASPTYGAAAREVRPWHLVVAWFVAAVIAVVGGFFLVAGVVGLVGGTNLVVGAVLTVLGLLVLAGDVSYARGVLRSRQQLAPRPTP